MSSTTALLIIDMQVGLVDGPQPAHQIAQVLGTIRQLRDAAQAAGAPVIYLQDKDVGGVDTPDWQIHPAVAPTQTDLVIRKAWSDSFFETELHTTLQERGVEHVVITGMKTEACVDMTTRRAVALGYHTTLVADGHSTTDVAGLSAGQLVAYHNDLLDGFGAQDGFGAGQHWVRIQPASTISFG